MAKVVVFQHVAYEILGTMNPLFKQAGIRIKYVNFGRHPDAIPNIDGYDALVILGGAMNVDEVESYPHLQTEVDIIKDAMAGEMPILGICLGAQLIAKAANASVKKSPRKEIGWYDLSLTEAGKQDRLLGHMSPTEKIFQWHGDTFDIPRAAVHLATSKMCPNQAYRIGDHIYGFQFHMEVDKPMIQRWLRVPANREELFQLRGVIDPEQIVKDTEQHIKHLQQLSHSVFSEFINLIGHKHTSARLQSR